MGGTRKTARTKTPTKDCPRCGHKGGHDPIGGVRDRNCAARVRWNGAEFVILARKATSPTTIAAALREVAELKRLFPGPARRPCDLFTRWQELVTSVDELAFDELPSSTDLSHVKVHPGTQKSTIAEWPEEDRLRVQEAAAVSVLRLAERMENGSAPAELLADISDTVGVEVLPAAAVVVRCSLARLIVTAEGLSALTFVSEQVPVVTTPYRPTRRASLPRVQRRITQPKPESARGAQFGLPGFAPESTKPDPFWLLLLYDKAGGDKLAAGHGAPWDLRLFVAALLHLRVDERDGQWRTLRFPVSEVIGWLHPKKWRNARRDWHRLPAALHRMNSLFLPVSSVGWALIAIASLIPSRPSDPFVEFTLRLPRSAAHGARIDWPKLCKYGAESAALYRTYLSVSTALDSVARNGVPITRQIGAPILDASGRPVRRPGGAVRRRSDVLVPHPLARIAPEWSDRDAASFIGFDPDTRINRTRTRRAFERLKNDGVIDLEPTRNGRFRIFGPPRQ